MSPVLHAQTPDIERVSALYADKAAEELRIGRADVGDPSVPDAGRLDAAVMFLKAEAGPAEAAGLPVLSGPDGQAVVRALEALGFEPDSWFATLVGEDGVGDATRALRATIEAVDPYAVVALDTNAGRALADAQGVEPLSPGRPVRVSGRVLLALDGLERSLGRPDLKRRVWSQLRALKPAPAPW